MTYTSEENKWGCKMIELAPKEDWGKIKPICFNCRKASHAKKYMKYIDTHETIFCNKHKMYSNGNLNCPVFKE
jgi:hypothetical protein